MSCRMVLLLVLLCAPLLGSACSPTGLASGLELRTDRGAYAAGELLTLDIHNDSQWDAWYFHCSHRPWVVVERRSAGRWEEFGNLNGPACPAIYAAGPAALAPGYRYILKVPLDPFPSGSYRIRLPTGTRSLRIGTELMHSNQFVVE